MLAYDMMAPVWFRNQTIHSHSTETIESIGGVCEFEGQFWAF